MRRAIGIVLGSCFLGGVLLAQGVELPRERAFGLVRTADGMPWGGATVELLARPIGDDETVGVADHLTVTADEQGKFGAAILTGLRYSVWAWKAGEDGSYRTSDLVEDVVPRQPILLTRSDAELRTRRVELALEEGIAEPVRVFVRARTTNVHVVELSPDPDGDYVVPPLPPAVADVEVFDAEGVPLVSRRFNPRPEGTWRLEVPARVPVRLLVRDIDSEGAPEAPFVAVKWGGRIVRVGDLAADGCGEVALPVRAEPIAFAKGKAGAGLVARPEGEGRRNGKNWPVLREAFEDERHAHVGPGVTLHGRVMLGSGRPAAGAWLVLSEYAMHYTERNSRSLDRFRRSFRLDAEGRFEIPHLLKEFPPSIALVLAPEHLAALPESWLPGLGPVVPSFVDLGRIEGLQGDAVHDLGDVDIDQLVPARLTILAPDGAPAIAASIVLEEVARRSIAVEMPTRWITDRSGCVSLLLPRDRSWCALLRADGGAPDLVTLSTDTGERLRDPVGIAFTMRPPIEITGRLVTAGGGPVEGLAVRVHPMGVQRLTEPKMPETRGEGPVTIEPRVDAQTFARIARDVLGVGTIRTDAQGRFRIPVPPVRMSYWLTANHVQIQIEVDGETDPEPIEIEVPR